MRGELRVEVLTDIPERFSVGSVLHIDGEPARVQKTRAVKRGLVVKFDLANDRPQAEKLRDLPLTVPSNLTRPLPEGSYYHYQIIDMEVRDQHGNRLGHVKEILSTGGTDVYVVASSGQKDLLLPALDHVILDVDVARKRITVRPPDLFSS